MLQLPLASLAVAFLLWSTLRASLELPLPGAAIAIMLVLLAALLMPIAAWQFAVHTSGVLGALVHPGGATRGARAATPSELGGTRTLVSLIVLGGPYLASVAAWSTTVALLASQASALKLLLGELPSREATRERLSAIPSVLTNALQLRYIPLAFVSLMCIALLVWGVHVVSWDEGRMPASVMVTAVFAWAVIAGPLDLVFVQSGLSVGAVVCTALVVLLLRRRLATKTLVLAPHLEKG